jgi:cytochrome P450
MRRQVIQISTENTGAHKDLSHPTIFHELLNSNLPDSEKSVERLTDEAQTVIGAGQETVAWILTVITCHLLSNPVVLRKLKIELATAIPDPDVITPEATLSNLPYLTGVIKEGLRLGYGVTSRLARVPHEPLVFPTKGRDWIIPAGTPVGMTSVLVHHDESIFPDSKEFRPERWIEDPRLDRYLIAFSKGSRQCLGMNLAYVEMYLWLAAVFGRFGSKEVRFESDEGVLELVDTDLSDVEIVGDRFVPIIKPESKGVRVRVLA